jgi:hypothetical protein
MTTSDSFFTASGSSPPVDAPSLPPELVEALATLHADALVADIRQDPNLAEVHANHKPTVESPTGFAALCSTLVIRGTVYRRRAA